MAMRSATPLTDRSQITRACDRLYSALRRGARDEDDGFFSSKTGSYWFYRSEENKVRHIFCLYKKESFAVTVVLSFQRVKPSRALGGLFVRMPDGSVGVTHSGRLSTGKSEFVRWYRRRFAKGRSVLVEWPDGRKGEYILIGQPGARDFQSQVARYVNAVQLYKDGRKPPIIRRPQRTATSYVPHSVHTTTGLPKRTPQVVVRRRHNTVVDVLARMLSQSGKKLWYDRERDLFVGRKQNDAKVLFEVKTDARTTSLYTGVGQLMLHGAVEGRAPLRVLVMPDKLDDETKTRLQRLKVRVLFYDMMSRRPRFSPRAIEDLLR